MAIRMQDGDGNGEWSGDRQETGSSQGIGESDGWCHLVKHARHDDQVRESWRTVRLPWLDGLGHGECIITYPSGAIGWFVH
jgi:hypothetical protein